MRSTIFGAAFAAQLFSLAAADGTTTSLFLIPSPTTTKALLAPTTIGCFATGLPLEDHGPGLFNTVGSCQQICGGLDKPVLGVVDGTNCWCGDLFPPNNTRVDMSQCDTPCSGFDKDNCGGNRKWLIVTSGTTRNRIDYFDPKSVSSASSTVKASSTTQAQQTVVVTASETPTGENKSSGPNKAGIAAGVVVGVVALVGIVAGVMFYLRHKRRREVEEEYRRQAAVNSFVAGNKLHTSNSSMTDSRLDPEFMMRRQSNGSIADNEDYSRRILKVRNPDE